MKLSNLQLRQIIKEEKYRILHEQPEELPDKNGHHWPRVDWNDVGELVDKWAAQEEKAFDKGDPSMVDGYDSLTDAKKAWELQVEEASMDMEAELTSRVRNISLQTMQEFTDKLINGDYA